MVEDVRKGPIDHVIAANAVLYPVNQANVTAKISSPVKRVLVNRGDHVKAGQLLIELESGDLAATANESKSLYDQAQSQLQTVTGATTVEDKAKAQADLQGAQQVYDAAKKVYDSRVELQKQGALAQRQVDDAGVTLAQALNALNNAKTHLETLNTVGQREQVPDGGSKRCRHESAFRELRSATGLRKDHDPDFGCGCRSSCVPGRNACERHTADLHRRHIERCGARQHREEEGFRTAARRIYHEGARLRHQPPRRRQPTPAPSPPPPVE